MLWLAILIITPRQDAPVQQLAAVPLGDLSATLPVDRQGSMEKKDETKLTEPGLVVEMRKPGDVYVGGHRMRDGSKTALEYWNPSPTHQKPLITTPIKSECRARRVPCRASPSADCEITLLQH